MAFPVTSGFSGLHQVSFPLPSRFFLDFFRFPLNPVAPGFFELSWILVYVSLWRFFSVCQIFLVFAALLGHRRSDRKYHSTSTHVTVD